jgi:hypothetical protein
MLYATARDYARAVGEGSQTTLGSSLVKPKVGTVTTRRLDVRTDVSDYLRAVVPHELWHIVVADRFRDGPAPLWFDEGVALAYDPPEKQALHARDLRLGVQQNAAFALSELLTLEQYPPRQRWGVFYGQSAALVRAMLTKGTPRQLLSCVERAPRGGMLIALRHEYGLQNWQAIETRQIEGLRPPLLRLSSVASDRLDPLAASLPTQAN